MVGGVETWQVYGFEGELVAEYNVSGTYTGSNAPATGTPDKEYGYRSGQMLVIFDNSETDVNQKLKWLVTDHLGSTHMEVGKNGALSTLRRHDYAPFGEELQGGQRVTAGYGYMTAGARQKFTGYEKDSETGLDFAQARYYANVQGRFTSVDPANAGAKPDNPQSWNGYAYVINNPTIYSDPDGKRFYFAAGAGHDPDKTGYISMMLKTFGSVGIQNPVDINVTRGKTSDILFTNGINSEVPYYNQTERLIGGDPTISASGGTRPASPDSRILDAVAAIKKDLAATPLEKGEQFNLTGYSTGTVILAQAALMLTREGRTIDNLVLIGTTIPKDSALYKALMNNENIKNIVRVDIPGDNAKDGVLAVGSFVRQGDSHPHFKYAFGENAQKNTEELGRDLIKQGVR